MHSFNPSAQKHGSRQIFVFEASLIYSQGYTEKPCLKKPKSNKGEKQKRKKGKKRKEERKKTF